jgi:hypothetical protein
MQLRVDMEQGTVRLDDSETAELAKREAAFAKRSERARWRGLDPSAREGEHRFAQRRHKQDRTALKKAVEEAAAQNDDERLKNSARRILDGTTLLYALTPTPDSAARVLAAGKPGMRAFFGYPDSNPQSIEPVAGHVLGDQAADYDWDDVTNNSRVVFDSPDSGGFRTLSGGKIFITEPSRTKAINALCVELGIRGRFDPVQDVLRHESQHEVDRIHRQDIERMGNIAQLPPMRRSRWPSTKPSSGPIWPKSPTGCGRRSRVGKSRRSRDWDGPSPARNSPLPAPTPTPAVSRTGYS